LLDNDFCAIVASSTDHSKSGVLTGDGFT
jgi:hypothetical protein